MPVAPELALWIFSNWRSGDIRTVHGPPDRDTRGRGLSKPAYELYRATVKAGTSTHDSWGSFVKNNVALYVVAAVVIALLFAGLDWAPWVGLTFRL